MGLWKMTLVLPCQGNYQKADLWYNRRLRNFIYQQQRTLTATKQYSFYDNRLATCLKIIIKWFKDVQSLFSSLPPLLLSLQVWRVIPIWTTRAVFKLTFYSQQMISCPLSLGCVLKPLNLMILLYLTMAHSYLARSQPWY